MVRRMILTACAVLVLWAAPAAAQYAPDIRGDAQERDGVIVVEAAGTAGIDFFSFEFFIIEGGELARTGSDNLVPMVQGGLVLIGGGSLLALVARRRRAQRQLAVS